MENNPTFKLLKITNAHGVVNYIPDNRMNRNHHETFKKALSKEKREKYLIEDVVLDVNEAAALGVAEAYYILNPPAKKQAAQNNSGNDALVGLLAAQIEANSKKDELISNLAARLDALEAPKTPKK